MSKKKVVSVVWVDAATNGGWKQPSMHTVGTSRIESVGYLVGDHDDYIEITTSISETGSCMDILSIPKAAILKRRRLKL